MKKNLLFIILFMFAMLLPIAAHASTVEDIDSLDKNKYTVSNGDYYRLICEDYSSEDLIIHIEEGKESLCQVYHGTKQYTSFSFEDSTNYLTFTPKEFTPGNDESVPKNGVAIKVKEIGLKEPTTFNISFTYSYKKDDDTTASFTDENIKVTVYPKGYFDTATEEPKEKMENSNKIEEKTSIKNPDTGDINTVLLISVFTILVSSAIFSYKKLKS